MKSNFIDLLSLNSEAWVPHGGGALLVPIEDVFVRLTWESARREKSFFFFYLQTLPLYAPNVPSDAELLGQRLPRGGIDRFYLGKDEALMAETRRELVEEVVHIADGLNRTENFLEYLRSEHVRFSIGRAKSFHFFTLMRLRRWEEALDFVRSEYWPLFNLDVSAFRASTDRIRDFSEMRDWERSEHEEICFYEHLLEIQDYSRISDILDSVRTRNIFRFNLNRYARLI